MTLSFKIAVASLGCAKNLVDTENMLGILLQDGHSLTSDAAEADIIIVNTCGFIGDAKKESIDTILEMAEYKQSGNCKALIVTGCLAERYKEEILDSIEEVDAVCGTGDFDQIAAVVEKVLSGERVAFYGHADTYGMENLPRVTTTPSHTAYLKIAEGCDNHCTYCVIPSLRGKFRSRSIEDICAEARELAANGVRELILIAQDTTRYGTDLYGTYALDKLLQALVEIEEIHWIRLHYMYPEAITDALLEAIAANDKILNYFDIPVQHGADTVLRRMGRRSNAAQMRALFNKIRTYCPDAVLRTSVIVGFPGETEEEFHALLDFVREVRFDRLGAFAYSKEEGTAAAKMEKQVHPKTKQARQRRVMALAQEISKEKNDARLGSIVEVLCEGYDEENYMYYGRSRGDSPNVDALVYFAASRELNAGEFVRVKVLCVEEYDLIGEMENEFTE